MSWKFAELGWRQDVGLYQSSYGLGDVLIKSKQECLVERKICVDDDAGRNWVSAACREHSRLADSQHQDFHRSRSARPRSLDPHSRFSALLTPEVRPSFRSSCTPLLLPINSASPASRNSYGSSSSFWKHSLLDEADSDLVKLPTEFIPQQPRDFLAAGSKVSVVPSYLRTPGLKADEIAPYSSSTEISLCSVRLDTAQFPRKLVSSDSANTSDFIHRTAWPIWASFPNPDKVQDHCRVTQSSAVAAPDSDFASSYQFNALTDTLELKGVVFEMLNTGDTMLKNLSISSDESEDQRQREDKSPKTDMVETNPFRRRMIGQKRKETPPRAIFTDFPTAYSSILDRSSEGLKMPSPSPGMESMEDPHAKLPACFDLPRTPDRFKPGPASARIMARLASDNRGPDVASWDVERPLTILLPPTPDLGSEKPFSSTLPRVRLQRDGPETPTCEDVGASHRQLDQDEETKLAEITGFGPEDVQMKVLQRVSSRGNDLRDSSRVGNSGPLLRAMTDSEDSLDRIANMFPSTRRAGKASRGRSNTLESIVNRYGAGSLSHRRRRSSFDDGRRRGTIFEPSQNRTRLAVSDDTDWLQHLEDSTMSSPFLKASLPARHAVPEGEVSGHIFPLSYMYPHNNPFAGFEVSNPGPSNCRDSDSHPDMSYQFRGRGIGDNKHMPFAPIQSSGSDDRADQGQDLSWSRCNGFGFRDVSGKELKQRRVSNISMKSEKSSFITDNKDRAAYHKALDDINQYLKTDKRWATKRAPEFPGMESSVRTSLVGLDLSVPESSRFGSSLSSRFGRGTKGSLDSRPLWRSRPSVRPIKSPALPKFHTPKKGDKGSVLEHRASVGLSMDVGAHDGGEDDGKDWETLPDSSSKSQLPTQSIPLRGPVGPSLSNLTSSGSLNVEQARPATPWGPLSKGSSTVTRHSKADTPCENRVRTIYGRNKSVTVPEYAVTRNGLQTGEHPGVLASPLPLLQSTRPSRSVPNRSHYLLYQHSSALEAGHAHPFTPSSPSVDPSPALQSSSVLGEEMDREKYDPHGLENRHHNENEIRHAKEGKMKSTNTINDTDERSIVSKVSTDGSYSGPDVFSESASISSLMHELDPNLPQCGGTFTKTTILGPKGNITGSLRGTGMRVTSSSEADFSSDPGILKNHYYDNLDEEHTTEPATPSSNTTAKGKGKTVTFEGRSSQSITGITTKDGSGISNPSAFLPPWNLQPVTSFALTQEKPLVHLVSTEDQIKERIELANRDMLRMITDCPIFPLHTSHTELTFMVNGEPGRPRCSSGDSLESDGKPFESAYCQEHKRWEFSHVPTLRRRVRTESDSVQHAVGNEINNKLVWIPLLGWIGLWNIWYDGMASRDLMVWYTDGKVLEFHQQEQEMAGVLFKRAMAVLMVAYVAAVAVCFWVVFH